MHDELRRLADAIGSAFGVKATVSMPEGTPPLVNPAGPVAVAREAASRVLGSDALVPLGFLNLAGEDFAFYLERMPGCFLRIGAREPGGEPIPAHSPRFYPAEESIVVGALVLAECARVSTAE
jgi:hippurate hydrolase